MQHHILISLASNHEQTQNLAEARRRLEQIVAPDRYSEAIWTDPVGGKGKEQYLNQLLYATTDMDVKQLETTLKKVERQMGRTQEERNQGVVRIDLDLMRYDNQRYHLRDWSRAYVKRLL